MDDNKTTEFQDFLMTAYTQYAERKKQWRPSLTDFARYLGVSPASLDHWLLGSRTPDLANAIKLAERLGPRVYELLGYPRMLVLNDPKLRMLVDAWEVLGDDARIEILSLVEREANRPR